MPALSTTDRHQEPVRQTLPQNARLPAGSNSRRPSVATVLPPGRPTRAPTMILQCAGAHRRAGGTRGSLKTREHCGQVLSSPREPDVAADAGGLAPGVPRPFFGSFRAGPRRYSTRIARPEHRGDSSERRAPVRARSSTDSSAAARSHVAGRRGRFRHAANCSDAQSASFGAVYGRGPGRTPRCVSTAKSPRARDR